MNGQLIGILAGVLASQARVLGMLAENQQRSAQGESMAYVEADFIYEAQQLAAFETEARQAAL